MMRMSAGLTGLFVLAVVALNAVPAAAQLRVVKVAKWSTLLAGGSSAAYGFTMNRRADADYRDIEAICKATPVRCVAHNQDGSYRDAALEGMYQDVRALDRKSRIALIGGQASLAASVVLFILDLRDARAPANVPYNPRKLTVEPGARGLMFRLAVP